MSSPLWYAPPTFPRRFAAGPGPMKSAVEIDITEYRLRFERPMAPSEAAHLRGFFGSAFAEEELLHHHRPDGSLVYQYPRVQFKVIDRTAHVIGLAEGGAVVERLWRARVFWHIPPGP